MKKIIFFTTALYAGIVSLPLFLADCGGSATLAPAPVAPDTNNAAVATGQQDPLDSALQEASAYVNSKIQAGAKLAVIAIQSEYPPLSEYIIDGIMANFVNDGKFTVVDRQQLDAIRDELKFQMSGEVDDNTVLGIGRMTGAQYIVLGSVSPIGSGNIWRISIRALSVQNAEVLGQFNKNIQGVGIIKEYGLGPVPATGTGAAHQPQASDGVITDTRDGKKYRIVKIANKTWMAENLNFKTSDSWCYDRENFNCEKHGRLYDWNAASEACPAGWHLPSNSEWNDLVDNTGGAGAGTRLKSKAGWHENGNGADSYGFSALPSGYYKDSEFIKAGYYSAWWTASEGVKGFANGRIMGYHSQSEGVNEINANKGDGFSVRCIKD